MGSNLLLNFGEAVAMILFGIGFANLMFQKNLIKKIIGFNIMDTASPMFKNRLLPMVRSLPSGTGYRMRTWCRQPPDRRRYSEGKSGRC